MYNPTKFHLNKNLIFSTTLQISKSSFQFTSFSDSPLADPGICFKNNLEL